MMQKSRPSRKKVHSPFAHNLRTALANRGLSLRAAAKLCDVPTSVISDWCNGAIPHDLARVQKICLATHMDFEWMLTGKTAAQARADHGNEEIQSALHHHEGAPHGTAAAN